MRNLNYYWRLFATFLSFSLFGLGGLVMSVTIFPLLYILPIPRAKQIRLSRVAVRSSFRFFIWFMRSAGVLTYELHNIEKIRNRDGLFIIANHPTLIDVVFLIAFANLPNCVVKQGVWNNPFMFFVVRAAGFIQNSLDPESLLIRCKSVLDRGDGLVLFPEGTRTDPDGAAIMKRGVAHIAIRSAKNLTPVYIACTPITLTKKHRWYNIPLESPPHFYIRVLEDIEIKPFLDLEQETSYSARALTDLLKETFK